MNGVKVATARMTAGMSMSALPRRCLAGPTERTRVGRCQHTHAANERLAQVIDSAQAAIMS
jgi:hypothetical protein